MSRGHSQPRNQPVRRVLERCKTRDTIEIIDVDKEKIDVVIVDVEETCNEESRGSGTSRRNSCPNVVISIDDEDGGDDDSFRNVHTDATNNEFCPASNNSPMSEESKSDECLIDTRGANPLFKSMENMRKYHSVGPSSVNRFGLGFSSESDSSESDSSEFYSSEGGIYSDSDSSDCEIIEDSSGNIREQWERAASKKRMTYRHLFGSDQVSASGSSGDPGSPGEETHSNMDVENCIKKVYSDHSREIPAESCPTHVNQNLSFHMPGATEAGDSHCKRNMDTTELDVDTATNIGDQEPEHVFETSSGIFQSTCENNSNNRRPVSGEPEVVLCTSSKWHLNMQHDQIQDEYVSSLEKDEPIKMATTCAEELHGESSFQGKGGAHAGPLSPCNLQPGDGEKLMPDSTIEDNIRHIPTAPLFSIQPQVDIHANPVTTGLQEKENPSFDEQPACNYHHSDGPLLNVDGKTTLEESSVCKANDGSRTNGMVILCAGSTDITQSNTDLIYKRERHKESDEYRRAVEEEWAARQRQLQIQAEEAQRLKRKKKAETLRLHDVERRQKQRLEEIRESQKKDEETINLKERLRAEVRKELEKMELRYRDMASLLRGLGIHVEGGPYPMPREVNAAYKQALLRFHPDRASRSDIHQQVRAEETFKVISRLKEKLFPVM